MVCVVGGEYSQTGCSSLYMMMIDKIKQCKITFICKNESDLPMWTDDDASDQNGPNNKAIEIRLKQIFELLNGKKQKFEKARLFGF